MNTFFLAAVPSSQIIELMDWIKGAFALLFSAPLAIVMVVVAVLAVCGLAWLCGYLWNRKWKPFDSDNMGSVAVFSILVVLLFCSATVYVGLNGNSFLRPGFFAKISAMQKNETTLEKKINEVIGGASEKKDAKAEDNSGVGEYFDLALKTLNQNKDPKQKKDMGYFTDAKKVTESMSNLLTMSTVAMWGMGLCSLALLVYASFNGYSRIKVTEMDKALRRFAEDAEALPVEEPVKENA